MVASFNMSDQRKAKCIVPFVSMSVHSTGHMTRCMMSEQSMGDISEANSPYDVWVGAKMDDLRSSMMDHTWSEGCRICRLKEESGLKSKRLHWQNVDYVADLWNDPKVFELGSNRDIYHLDIAFNNKCNFKCRMCSAAYSSRWRKDEELLREMGVTGGSSGNSNPKTAVAINDQPREYSAETLEKVVKNLLKVRRIEVVGGEPFLTESMGTFLDLCAQYGIGKNVEFMVTTNGSKLSKEYLDKLNIFDYVNLNISIDATGNLFEYMRSSGAFSWGDLQENIQMALNYCEQKNNQYPEKSWKVNLNYSYQVYNMLHLYDAVTWMIDVFGWRESLKDPELFEKQIGKKSKNRNSFEIRVLVGPKVLAVKAAPLKLKQQASEQFFRLVEEFPLLKNMREWDYFEGIKNSLKHNPDDEEYRERLWAGFWRYTEALDEIREENILSVNPDFSQHRSDLYDSNATRR